MTTATRLYTDIAADINAGAVAALVMSDGTDAEMLSRSRLKPDYVAADVAEIAKALGGYKVL